MKLLSHGPEPCASANSAIPAYNDFYFYTGKPTRGGSILLNPHKLPET